MQVAITTRSATLLAERFQSVVLDVFDKDEALQYIHARLAANGRTTTDDNAAALVSEVGLLPQQLDLAASYLQQHTHSIALSSYALQMVGCVVCSRGCLLIGVLRGLAA